MVIGDEMEAWDSLFFNEANHCAVHVKVLTRMVQQLL